MKEISEKKIKELILSENKRLNDLPLSIFLTDKLLSFIIVRHSDGRTIKLSKFLHKSDRVFVISGKLGDKDVVVKFYESKEKDVEPEISMYQYMKKYAEKRKCNLINFYTGFSLFGRTALVLDKLELLNKKSSYLDLGIQILDQLRCLHRKTTYNSLKDENIVWKKEGDEVLYYLIDFGSVGIPYRDSFIRKSWPCRWSSQSKSEKITYPYYDLIELARVMKHLWNLQNGVSFSSKNIRSGFTGTIKKYHDYVKKIPKVAHYSSKVYKDLQKILAEN